MRFPSNLTSGWPWLTPVWSLILAMHYGWSVVLPKKIGGHRTFLGNLTFDFDWPQYDFWSSNASHNIQWFFLPNLVVLCHLWAIWPLVDLNWPQHDLWSQQCINHTLVRVSIKSGNHRDFMKYLTSDWPWLKFLHDLELQQCVMLNSGVLPTKFCSHRAFLRELNLWMTLDL